MKFLNVLNWFRGHIPGLSTKQPPSPQNFSTKHSSLGTNAIKIQSRMSLKLSKARLSFTTQISQNSSFSKPTLMTQVQVPCYIKRVRQLVYIATSFVKQNQLYSHLKGTASDHKSTSDKCFLVQKKSTHRSQKLNLCNRMRNHPCQTQENITR